MVLAYFTPDVALPVASLLAAAVGFVMMVGRAPIRFVTRTLAGLRERRRNDDASRPS